MKRAIYPLSGDPITYGHLNVIERARRVFDEVIVAIGINETKKPLFSLEERKTMIEHAIRQMTGIRVIAFRGMLVDFAYRVQISTILRGARNAADFDYERLLGDVNYYQGLGIDTHILMTDPNLSHVSSSAAKAIVLNSGKNILNYVPLFVKRKLEVALLGQHRIGITGGIAAGKSYVARYFQNDPSNLVHEIDTDRIGHFILGKSQEPRDFAVREQVADAFGRDLLKKNGVFDFPKLGERIFKDAKSRQHFDSIVKEAMHHELRMRLLGIKGTVLINCAILVEAGLMDLVNNNVIVVDCPRASRVRRMQARGYSDEKIKQRLKAQHSTKKKIDAAREKIERDNTGSLIIYKNGDTPQTVDPINNLYQDVKRALEDNNV